MSYNILVIQSINVFLFFVAMVVWTSVITRITNSRLKPAFKQLGTIVSIFAILLSGSFVLINYFFSIPCTVNLHPYFYHKLIWEYILVVFLIIMGFWSSANIQLFNCGAYNDVILDERRKNRRSTDEIPNRRSTDPS